jgi:hypothetical protein
MKKPPKKAPKPDIVNDFINDLVKNPETLGKFIIDPNGEMDKAAIPKKHRRRIKNLLGFGIAKKLVRVEAYYVQHP